MTPSKSEPVRYPVPEELFIHLSGRTGKIFRWLLSQTVQDAIGGKEGWKITICGKGSSIQTTLELRESLE